VSAFGVLLAVGSVTAGDSSSSTMRLRRKDLPSDSMMTGTTLDSLLEDKVQNQLVDEVDLLLDLEDERELEDFPMSMSIPTTPSPTTASGETPTPTATPVLVPDPTTPTASPLMPPETPSPTVPSGSTIPTSQPIFETLAPTVAVPREETILMKCGVSGLERSRDILTELSSISDPTVLLTPSTPQFLARDWLDNRDGAIICASESAHIQQRFKVAVLYYGMAGPSSWTNCKAEEDVIDSEDLCLYQDVRSTRRLLRMMEENWNEEEAVRFLSEKNECEWFGLDCGEAYSVGSTSFFPLLDIDLGGISMSGSILPEMVAFPSLESLALDGNRNITGTIPSEVDAMKELKFFQVDDNALTGELPESLFTLSKLISLDVNANMLTGTLSESIGSLKSLEALQLENNSFGGLLPTEAFLNLKNLGTWIGFFVLFESGFKLFLVLYRNTSS